MPSPTAKRLTGTYIVDSFRPMTSLAAWAQEECRNGSLRGLIERFIEGQPEPLDASLTIVEKVEEKGILAKLPCKLLDHESVHPFRADVWIRINPLVREIERVEPT